MHSMYAQGKGGPIKPLSPEFSLSARQTVQTLEAGTDLELEAFDIVAVFIINRRCDTELQRA